MLKIHQVFMDKMPRSMIHLAESYTNERTLYIETTGAQRAQMNLKQTESKRRREER